MRDPATKAEWLHSMRHAPRPIILPLLCWLGVIACVIWIVAGLSGCATAEPSANVCFVQFMGRTEEGLTVVRQLCMTPEAFAETQK